MVIGSFMGLALPIREQHQKAHAKAARSLWALRNRWKFFSLQAFPEGREGSEDVGCLGDAEMVMCRQTSSAWSSDTAFPAPGGPRPARSAGREGLSCMNGKLSRRVLRRGGVANASSLPSPWASNPARAPCPRRPQRGLRDDAARVFPSMCRVYHFPPIRSSSDTASAVSIESGLP